MDQRDKQYRDFDDSRLLPATRPRRSAGSCCAWPTPTTSATSPTPTRSAPRCRCSSTARTSVRTPGWDGSTCPQDDLADEGVTAAQLEGTTTPSALRSVVAREVRRAEELLAAGAPLVRRLSGWSRLAVAGYVAGGQATADALRAADYDVLSRTIKPAKLRTAALLAMRLLVGRDDVTDRALEAAYAECERITREQARNFAWGIRLLPAPKRRALSAVYAMARRIDDIGDGDLPEAEKLRLLADARKHADRTRSGTRRSGAGRARRRRRDAADPAERVRRTRRRLRDGRAGPPLRDARRTRRVLPLRRRLDRPALARRLRPGARLDDRGTRARSRRRARRRAAADQHPARHPRGPRQRPHLPARARPGPVRRATSSSVPTAPSTRSDGALAELDPVRGRARVGLVRPRPAAAAAARPPQRGLLRGHGRASTTSC